ncbi:hypothetical protein Tco_1326692 [Tanacetum coccineum]
MCATGTSTFNHVQMSHMFTEPAYLEFMPPKEMCFPAEGDSHCLMVSQHHTLADLPDDEEEEAPLKNDADDDEKDEDEEEEERLALDDFVLPSQTSTYGARITVQPQPPMAASTKALIVVVAATLPLPSPPPSPLISYSSPLPQIPSPPFLVPLPPTTSPTYTEVPLGYKAVGIRLRTASPPPLPLSSPLPLPSLIILSCNQAIYGHYRELLLAPIHLQFSTIIEDSQTYQGP